MPNLSLDASFGDGGKIHINANSLENSAVLIAAQPDGSVVVADTDGGDISVHRLTPNGTLDGTFGNGGEARIGLPFVPYETRMAVQPDGSIIVTAEQNDFMLARLTPAGQLDSSFGIAGLLTTHAGLAHSQAQAVAVQPDGNVIVAGLAMDVGNFLSDNRVNWKFALARYQGFDLSVVGTEGDDSIAIELGTLAGTLRTRSMASSPIMSRSMGSYSLTASQETTPLPSRPHRPVP